MALAPTRRALVKERGHVSQADTLRALNLADDPPVSFPPHALRLRRDRTPPPRFTADTLAKLPLAPQRSIGSALVLRSVRAPQADPTSKPRPFDDEIEPKASAPRTFEKRPLPPIATRAPNHRGACSHVMPVTSAMRRTPAPRNLDTMAPSREIDGSGRLASTGPRPRPPRGELRIIGQQEATTHQVPHLDAQTRFRGLSPRAPTSPAPHPAHERLADIVEISWLNHHACTLGLLKTPSSATLFRRLILIRNSKKAETVQDRAQMTALRPAAGDFLTVRERPPSIVFQVFKLGGIPLVEAPHQSYGRRRSKLRRQAYK